MSVIYTPPHHHTRNTQSHTPNTYTPGNIHYSCTLNTHAPRAIPVALIQVRRIRRRRPSINRLTAPHRLYNSPRVCVCATPARITLASCGCRVCTGSKFAAIKVSLIHYRRVGRETPVDCAVFMSSTSFVVRRRRWRRVGLAQPVVRIHTDLLHTPNTHSHAN